jgi:AcrR family transcriptional regulator
MLSTGLLMRRTKEDAGKTRNDILNAAVALFAEKGVSNTSLQEIARAANVTRGAVYWHFKNKVEVFDALHERLHRPFVDMILEDIEKDHPEPLDQLRALCINILLQLETDIAKTQALKLFLIRCEYTGDLASYKAKHRAKKAESMKLFCRYFEKAQQQGKLPPNADPELLAMSVNCFMKGILFEYLDNPDQFPLREKVPQLINQCFNSFCPNGSVLS